MPLLEIKALHVDKHPAVDRRVGGGHHPNDDERVMLWAVISPVGRLDRITHAKPRLSRDGGTEHRFKETRVLEVATVGKLKTSTAAPLQLAKQVGIGADHPIAAVVVAHADRRGDRNTRSEVAILAIAATGGRQKLGVKLPGNVFDRLADVVDAVEHKLQWAALGSHDHVVAQARSRLECLPHNAAGDQRGDHEAHAESEREDGQAAGERPLPNVSPGDSQERHASTPSATEPGLASCCSTRLNDSIRTRRENCAATSGVWVTTTSATFSCSQVCLSRSTTCC